MPYVVKDRVKVTSTTTGTGTFTLGAAVAGFQDFSAIALSAPWNVTTSTYVQAFSVAAQDTAPSGVFFKPDGTKMYVSGDTGNNVYEYDLSTAWNVSTASYLQSFSVAGQTTNPASPFFKTDGTKMYVLNRTTDSVLEYSLSSAWNISTATYSQAFSVASQETNPLGLFISDDGLKMYVTGDVGDDVNEYTLSVAWDISTATYVRIFSVAAQETGPSGIFFKTDGTQMYIVGRGQDTVFQYSLSTAWNISTAYYSKYFSIGGFEGDVQGIYFKPDGMKMYVVGYANDLVLEFDLGLTQTYYCITNGTDWEVGVGTTPYPGTTLVRSTVLESSNSNNKVDWAAGSKDVFCTYPADATEGTVPTADNSSVGTDLYAWTNLKKQLDAGVINGVPYNNSNTAGMVSTITVLSRGYWGGVLSQNGDIHCVPSTALVGQKINYLSGVVSTYSLVYATSTTNLYQGGVLAPNGDIHFVPRGAVAGQKISASGVVSTYSLVYTTTNAYYGGVLSPSGEVHFVPASANRGQKISTAGVVSTYSLVYTTTTAYNGGVLAPNGDIHFVPGDARVGQKVSAAGVVSTYSLAYTIGNAYGGGVLAPNGDIHFVPDRARVGQKISSSGAVSTYSLVLTMTSGAYTGGVLAPNGDIHFIQNAANVGQKVSANGIVSTYPVIVTDAAINNKFNSGVLAPNGEIYCIPFSANDGTGTVNICQKISTNTTRPIGYALSPFFNKY